MSARVVVAMALVLAIMAAKSTPAQPSRAASFQRSNLQALPVQRFAFSPTQGRPDRVKSRRDYMVLGGFVGGMVGAVYVGARMGSGVSAERSHVFATPLIGVALGATVGALWFGAKAARSAVGAPR